MYQTAHQSPAGHIQAIKPKRVKTPRHSLAPRGHFKITTFIATISSPKPDYLSRSKQMRQVIKAAVQWGSIELPDSRGRAVWRATPPSLTPAMIYYIEHVMNVYSVSRPFAR